MNLILFGPPGVGKGTQAVRIAQAYHLHVLSTGEILRAEVEKDSEIGRHVKDLMNKGLFPPDDLILDLVRAAMEEISEKKAGHNQGFIFDGVPRTLFQAYALEKILQARHEKIECGILLSVDEDMLVNRLKARYSCHACGAVYNDLYQRPSQEGVCDQCGEQQFVRRPDDEEQTIRMRLKVYAEKTRPVLSFYEEKGVVQEVDGMKNPDEVFLAIKSILSKFVGKA